MLITYKALDEKVHCCLRKVASLRFSATFNLPVWLNYKIPINTSKY